MGWSKLNLVTKKDRKGTYDEWGCSSCGYTQRYYTLNRASECPKCKPVDVEGCWSLRSPERMVCRHCGVGMVECPKEGHPNSKYWNLRRNDEVLYVCSVGCLENGQGERRQGVVIGKPTIVRLPLPITKEGM
jgi:hypothetical protein